MTIEDRVDNIEAYLRTSVGSNKKVILSGTKLNNTDNSNETYKVLQVVADTTFVSIEDDSLLAGTHPTTMLAGTVIYGLFHKVVITSGTVYLYM